MSDRSWSLAQLRSELERYEAELRIAGKEQRTIDTYPAAPQGGHSHHPELTRTAWVSTPRRIPCEGRCAASPEARGGRVATRLLAGTVSAPWPRTRGAGIPLRRPPMTSIS